MKTHNPYLVLNLNHLWINPLMFMKPIT